MRYKSKHSQYCIHSRICVYGIPSCVCNLLWMAVVMMYMHEFSPRLSPSGPRSMRLSSIWPYGENMSLMSFSLHFFEIIPINSFLSSIAEIQERCVMGAQPLLFGGHCGNFFKP